VTGGSVRPLERGDMPQVTELYRSIGEGARGRPADEVMRKLTECFVDVPFPDAGAPTSFVHVGSDGRLAGFIGLIPRRWKFHDETVIGLATTGLVVDPNHPDAKHSTLWLTREGLGQKEYAFSITDKPTDVVTKMRTGGAGKSTNVVWRSHVITGHGFRFRIGLRTIEDTRQRLRDRLRWRRYWPVLAPIDSAVRRVAHALDDRRERPIAGKRADDLTFEPATAASVHDTRLALAKAYTPCLVDDPVLAKWQYDFLADYPSRGAFHWYIARAGGEPVGWFLYYVREDKPSEVASVVALPRWKTAVCVAMLEHARRDGATGLIGTTSGVMAHELIELGATIIRADRLLVACRDEKLLEGFRSTHALITGLESEIWI
jgi:hypothetical protein